ncbi:hypothetical protein YT1_2047 [Rhodococcus ruber]|nr:hypothetical protein YT1_2047 [Rhodococcus ruber]
MVPHRSRGRGGRHVGGLIVGGIHTRAVARRPSVAAAYGCRRVVAGRVCARCASGVRGVPATP